MSRSAPFACTQFHALHNFFDKALRRASTKPYVVMEAWQNAKTSLARFRKMLFGASTESKDNC